LQSFQVEFEMVSNRLHVLGDQHVADVVIRIGTGG